MDPSEDAPKLPEAAKPKPKKRSKPKAKKRRVVKSKPKKKTTARRAVDRKHNGDARTERLDMRLTKAQKTKIDAKAKKTKRTVTSLVTEAIGKIR